jgi:hypothetical protein
MVVLLLAVELEILNEQAAADRDKLMLEVSQAYRNRSRCLSAVGRLEAAQSDLKRAEQLEKDAKKLAEGQIELINRWTGPVTVLIDGVPYRLAVGESKLITRQAGPFRYELPATGQVSNGRVEAGKVFGVQIR